MSDDFVRSTKQSNASHTNNTDVKTWKDFVVAIGPQNKKQFPIREQQKNDCTVMSAISAYEVQNRVNWTKPLSKIGQMKQTIEKGAHLQDTYVPIHICAYFSITHC